MEQAVTLLEQGSTYVSILYENEIMAAALYKAHLYYWNRLPVAFLNQNMNKFDKDNTK